MEKTIDTHILAYCIHEYSLTSNKRPYYYIRIFIYGTEYMIVAYTYHGR